LCGDVAEEHQLLVEELLGQPLSDTVALLSPPALVPISGLSHDYVPVTESIQSSLRIGRLWPASTHPDIHRLQVLVKVLGGYFGSRLMKNIREDKGFTYGIYASVSPREHASSFVIGTDVNATSASIAVQEIHHELRLLQQEPIAQEELQTVKNYMTGKFANELSTVFEQCDKYRSIVLSNLPANYYSEFIEQVNGTNSEQLLLLAQEYLSPDAMIEVIAGPAR
jgi:predicted Zn-dependent peptidase